MYVGIVITTGVVKLAVSHFLSVLVFVSEMVMLLLLISPSNVYILASGNQSYV